MVLIDMAASVELLLAAGLGYLLGAIPTGVLVCKVLRSPDVLELGSGHTGGLNVTRSAGIWAGVLTSGLDVCLGAAAVAATAVMMGNPWAAAVAGVMAVVGHNWSVFIRFGGGIGLSNLLGALLAYEIFPALAGMAAFILAWLVLIKVLNVHRARATILLMAAAGPFLWLLGLAPPGIFLGAAGGLMVILKTLPDWKREYE